MFFKRFPLKLCICSVIGFVLGTLLTFVLPPVIIAIIESIILILLCWSFYCH